MKGGLVDAELFALCPECSYCGLLANIAGDLLVGSYSQIKIVKNLQTGLLKR